ncbi:MAG: enoyl-CoA hydratase, partial [Candidatus Eremiobacteraeota bacterium]|nr:enoyl-CoA hydratase [Candidatus Eremiobacteraeota bacterium]
FDPRDLPAKAADIAQSLAAGPSLAHAMTKRMLHEEWSMPLDGAIDAEARAQARLMETNDFKRAYDAFVAKKPPEFAGD